MKSKFLRLAIPVGLLAAAGVLISRPDFTRRVGSYPDGFQLNSGWTITPAGRQLDLDTFPMSSVLTADGKFLVVLQGGYNPPSLSVIDAKTEKVVSSIGVPDAWLGLVLTADSRTIYVGGGSRASVFEFQISTSGKLSAGRTFELVEAARRTHRDFIGDVQLSPDGRLLYCADLYRDRVLVVNPQSGRVIETYPTGRRPYRILFHPDGKSYFVTSWADGALYHHEAATGKRIDRVILGAHTTDMIWRDAKTEAPKNEEGEPGEAFPWAARIFVAASNTNRVFSVGVSASKELRMIETINVAMTPRQPLGMTPSALAMTPDQSRLFVVCSDANAVAVADVTTARSQVLGFIPTGWYPIAARVVPGNKLVVFNGRGKGSYPNHLNGPNPSVRPSPIHQGVQAVRYVGRLQRGTASFVDWEEGALAGHTRKVMENSPYRDRLLDEVSIPAGNPVPGRPGDPSPIQHVIYVVKENRTYDQMLGDLGKGNGDPSITLFPEKITPNHHQLAREFVLFDNFYVSADVSADGHNWSTAAIAPDYVQKMWPNSYAGRRKHYDYEGGEPAALPPAGYIWTNAAAAQLSIRNLGYWAVNTKTAAPAGGVQIESVKDPVLAPVTNRKYRGFDMDYRDVDRVKVFIEELGEWEKAGQAPRLTLVRLGNDHTSGTSPGKHTPFADVADNDWALGMLVEACSKSRFWPKMAIFVIQDDAQNGPDHVDSHRAPAYILSPYTRRGGLIDSTLYNTTSMLRTMELILGLRPMTHFDAAAQPMWNAFSAQPDLTQYAARVPQTDLNARNPEVSATAARSEAMDFSEADRIDDDELNDILWRALRETAPPVPTRSYFAR